MAIDPLLMLKRKRFEGGVLFEGREGLERMSVAAEMSSHRPDEFRARVVTDTFGEMLTTRMRAQHLNVHRTEAFVEDEYAEYLQIGIVSHGRLHTRQNALEQSVTAGNAVALLGRLPFQTWTERPVEVMQIYLPMAVVEGYGFRPDAWAGRSWEGTPSLAGLLRLMLSVVGVPDAVTESSRIHLGLSLRELTLAVLHEGSRGVLPAYDTGDTHRTRARMVIAARFTDPSFDVAALAAALHVSVRHLHTLFRDEEFGAGELLRRTRLDHAARLLSTQTTARVTVAAVAAASGLRAEDAFTRAFKRVYGSTPSEYRRSSVP